MKILSSLNKLGLLPKVAIAIVLGICFSFFFPRWAVGIFVTINGIFGNFLSFTIPLIILGLVAPGIAELGKGAGRLLGITALFAYVSTLLSGFFSFFTCDWIYPKILDNTAGVNELTATGAQVIEPFFTVAMPPMMDVTSSLLFAFVMGLGVAGLKEDNLRNV